MGLKVHGRIIDTMIAGPIVNENSPMRFSLDELGKKYAGEKKSQSALYEAAKSWGVNAKTEL